MPSITSALETTQTAKWYRDARAADGYAKLSDRLICFDALNQILAGERAPRQTGHRWSQPLVSPPTLPEIARHTSATRSTLYNWWGPEQHKSTCRRWAGEDRDVKPGTAFLAEAKVVSFWPYRVGALQIADRFEMTLVEVTAAYFHALAAWASDQPVLAACKPVGPPGCVAEDLTVIANRLRRPSRPGRLGTGSYSTTAVAEKLMACAQRVMQRIFEDASLTPLGAYDSVRATVTALLASEHSGSLFGRLSVGLAELADRLGHGEEDALTPSEQRELLGALDELRVQLASRKARTGPACGRKDESPGEIAGRDSR
jgi:hypothetical protein